MLLDVCIVLSRTVRLGSEALSRDGHQLRAALQFCCASKSLYCDQLLFRVLLTRESVRFTESQQQKASRMRKRMPFLETARTPYFLAALIVLACVAVPADSSNARTIADGQPWLMKTATGQTGRMTLLPNGAGKMRRGPLSIRLSWTAIDDGICITSRVQGRQCVELKPSTTGFVGVRDDEVVFTLSRNGP